MTVLSPSSPTLPQALRELVDGNIQVLEAPGSTWEGAQDVEPLDREGPGERDCPKGLSWLIYILGMELARFTLGY